MDYPFPDTLPADALREIAYFNGLDVGNKATGLYLGTSDYTPTHKWQVGDDGSASATAAAQAGTGGGTVTYSFSDAHYKQTVGDVTYEGDSVWTAEQENNVVAALTLWSDIANITFVKASEATTPQATFYGFDTEGEGAVVFDSSTVQGTSGIETNYSADVVLDTNPDSKYGDISSILNSGGEGVSTILHELGHLLGLGHGGPYNGSADPATQQYTAYDNRLYTIMSYIEPYDTTAQHYTNNGTNWTDSEGAHAPTTPMVFDILAIQQLYGGSITAADPETGAYGGGQIFGFNCNIADASNLFYDFEKNPTPVVTLFDYGTNNKLDLSGYSTACTVNLNQGAFSSIDGLTNNIGIAYGTKIDTAIGGDGNDTFIVNADADTIDGRGGSNTVVFSRERAAYNITYSAGAFTVTDTDTSTGVADVLTNIQTAKFSDKSETLCFLAGTRIRTPSGEAAIETLRPGDLVLTADGEVRPMIWLGHLTVSARFADPIRSFPIRIKAGALAEKLPSRDLLVSPDHALLVEDVLIHAGALVNGASIVRETAVPESFVYFHVELDDHALILAEDVPAESFVDNVDRMNFDNWAEHQAICPEGRAIEEMPHPRAKSRRQVPQRIRMALDRRAEAIGLAPAAAAAA